jgi:2',3'-cyclic-nucleotide 2'-phosphodiesterase (5'-nucleotidase family)
MQQYDFMKKKAILMNGMAACLLTLTACSRHYQLASVERTRILIDQRYDATADIDAAKWMEAYKPKVDSMMSPRVGKTAKYLAAYRPESELSNLLTDILMWGGKAFHEQPDFAVYNMGGIRADLVKGDVTYEDVLSIAPFENKICFITLTGEKMMDLFRQIARRGGEGVSKGTELVISEDGELLSARLHGEDIDSDEEYRIATINYLIEGNDGMPALKEGTNVVAPTDPSNNTRYLIMNFFRDKLKRGEVVDAKEEGRIIVKSEQ